MARMTLCSLKLLFGLTRDIICKHALLYMYFILTFFFLRVNFLGISLSVCINICEDKTVCCSCSNFSSSGPSVLIDWFGSSYILAPKGNGLISLKGSILMQRRQICVLFPCSLHLPSWTTKGQVWDKGEASVAYISSGSSQTLFHSDR